MVVLSLSVAPCKIIHAECRHSGSLVEGLGGVCEDYSRVVVALHVTQHVCTSFTDDFLGDELCEYSVFPWRLDVPWWIRYAVGANAWAL